MTAPRHVVVVGGGAVGALFVHHVVHQATGPFDVTVVEPRQRLGAGTAYSTDDPLHTTNIPARRMGIDPDNPEAFARWLDARGEPPASGHPEAPHYPRRGLFGAFMAETLEETLAARPDIRLAHSRATALSIGRDGAPGGGLLVHTDRGPLTADAVALATGNAPPLLPGPLQVLAGHPRMLADPWAAGGLAGLLATIPTDARVLIVGTGLTMGDAVVGLRARGHRGGIVALSRHGRVPRRGVVEAAPPFGDFRRPARTARALLARFRAAVRGAEVAGHTWHSVLAAARAQGWELWGALPDADRRRFVRHLRGLYEMHRHVMPGPVADHLDAERQAGTLVVQAARLKAAQAVRNGIEVDLAPRGAPTAIRRERFDAVLNCTGPSYGGLVRHDPLWSAAARDGLVRPDPAGLGIDTDRCGRALGRDGAAADLLVLGTLARYAFGELTGVRELSAQTRLAAQALLSTWAGGPRAGPVDPEPVQSKAILESLP